MDPLRSLRSLLAALAIASGLAAPLGAQSESLAVFADSLDRIGDARLVQAMLARSAEDQSPRQQVERGLLYTRLYALTGDDAALGRARAVFDSARKATPADPWPHWGYAAALARGPGIRSNGDVLAVTGRGNDPVIQLRFDDVAAPDESGVVHQLRTVESEFDAGIYRIRVTVVDAERQVRAFTERQFSVVER